MQMAVFILTSCLVKPKPITGSKRMEKVTLEDALLQVKDMDVVVGHRCLAFLVGEVSTGTIPVVGVAMVRRVNKGGY